VVLAFPPLPILHHMPTKPCQGVQWCPAPCARHRRRRRLAAWPGYTHDDGVISCEIYTDNPGAAPQIYRDDTARIPAGDK